MNKKYIGIGTSLGLCFGAGLGAMLRNVGLWSGIGMVFGAAFGAVWAARRARLRDETRAA